jgi:hypothetical protein
MTTETHLTLDEENAVETLIDASIIARYDSEIEYREAYGDECSYFPLDRITLRELLVELWGNLLAPEAIEAAFARLVEDGAEEGQTVGRTTATIPSIIFVLLSLQTKNPLLKPKKLPKLLQLSTSLKSPP